MQCGWAASHVAKVEGLPNVALLVAGSKHAGHNRRHDISKPLLIHLR